MPSPLLERRRHPRLPVRDLHVQIEGYGDVPAYAPNLSVNGFFILTRANIPRGALLRLKFRLSDTGDEIQTCGEVRWVVDGVGVGIEFLAMAPEMKRRIMQQLEIISTGHAAEGQAGQSAVSSQPDHIEPET